MPLQLAVIGYIYTNIVECFIFPDSSLIFDALTVYFSTHINIVNGPPLLQFLFDIIKLL